MLKGSAYIITGGMSGLGKCAVKLLLSQEVNVTILDIRPPLEDDLSQEKNILFLQIDITSEKEVTNALDVHKRRFGQLNGVINCADVRRVAPMYNLSTNEPHNDQEFLKILDMNLLGPFNVIRLTVPFLIENAPNFNGERGIIVNISSMAGWQGKVFETAYSASKAGLIALTSPLAQELNCYDIRVADIASEQDTDENEFMNLLQTVIENQSFNGTCIKIQNVVKV